MPQADPEAANFLGGRRELERVARPRGRILDAAILAQRAIHPRERHFVDRDSLIALRVPARHDVGDAQPEAVAVGESECRVVDESRRRHRVFGDAGMDADVVLPNAAHRRSGYAPQPPPVPGQGGMIFGGREAAVEPDRVAARAHRRQNPARLCRLGTVGEIARAHRLERGRAAEDEPRGVDAGGRFLIQDAGDALKYRVESQ